MFHDVWHTSLQTRAQLIISTSYKVLTPSSIAVASRCDASQCGSPRGGGRIDTSYEVTLIVICSKYVHMCAKFGGNATSTSHSATSHAPIGQHTFRYPQQPGRQRSYACYQYIDPIRMQLYITPPVCDGSNAGMCVASELVCVPTAAKSAW
jgi:hypothetical protein